MSDATHPARPALSWSEIVFGRFAPVLVALPMAVPVATILVLALWPSAGAGTFLSAGQLVRLASNTALLCFGAVTLSLLMGVASAWIVAAYNFPGRTLLSWLALLPLAMPGYIIAFVYVDFFDYAGPLQSALRGMMGWTSPDDYMFPPIRSIGGAAFVFALVLYPYVYMAARTAFARLPASQVMAARTLGRKPLDVLFAVALPQARPALAIGAALVIMECLNDIGSVSFFGVQTFALAIFSTWLDQGSLGGAAQLSMLMLGVILLLVFIEQTARRHDGLAKPPAMSQHVTREPLTGVKAWGAALAVFAPVFLGFVLPVLLLLMAALRRIETAASPAFLSALQHSVLLALAAAAAAVLLALILNFGGQQSRGAWKSLPMFLANLGYAIPGTILAIGVIVPLSLADHSLNALTSAWFDWKPGLILSGTVFALLFAYVARFLLIASSMVDSGSSKIPPSLTHAARTLGRSPLGAYLAVHLPLLRPALVAAALLVFVDAMKELPATLLLRPFDFDTLSTLVFTTASLGQLEESALPALAIVLAGLAPIYILMSSLHDKRT